MTEKRRSEIADDLKGFLSFLSEAVWSAGWRSGLEFDCWEMAVDIKHPIHSMLYFNWSHMLQLAHQCDGWWAWTDIGKKVFFLPMRDWLEVYQNNRVMGRAAAQKMLDQKYEVLAFDQEHKR